MDMDILMISSINSQQENKQEYFWKSQTILLIFFCLKFKQA